MRRLAVRTAAHTRTPSKLCRVATGSTAKLYVCPHNRLEEPPREPAGNPPQSRGSGGLVPHLAVGATLRGQERGQRRRDKGGESDPLGGWVARGWRFYTAEPRPSSTFAAMAIKAVFASLLLGRGRHLTWEGAGRGQDASPLLHCWSPLRILVVLRAEGGSRKTPHVEVGERRGASDRGRRYQGPGRSSLCTLRDECYVRSVTRRRTVGVQQRSSRPARLTIRRRSADGVGDAPQPGGSERLISIGKRRVAASGFRRRRRPSYL